MTRAWQPGDVALVTFGRTPNGDKFGSDVNPTEPGTFVAVARPCKFAEGGVIWASAGGGGGHSNRKDVVTDARPLVVIDPENREQAERLDKVIRAAYSVADVLNPDPAGTMQAALREFANPTPPKPAEPSDPAVRVIDQTGITWAADRDAWYALGEGMLSLSWDGLCDRGPLEIRP